MNRSLVTTDILDERISLYNASLFSGMMAKIDSYEKSKRRAKVEPLEKILTKSGWKNLPVVTLPVQTLLGGGIEFIPNYKKGDIVYLSPGRIPTHNTLKAQFETDTSRLHALENMVIQPGFVKQPSTLSPSMQKDGLVITDNESMYVQFSSNLYEIKIGSSATQKALLGEDTRDLVEELLDVILDLIVMTPTGPSSPISAMPANTAKIEMLRAKLNALLSSNVKHN